MVNRVAGAAAAPLNPGRPKPAISGAGQFSVTGDSPAAIQENAPTQSVSLAAMLALQEAQSGTIQDKAARRHGFALLEALSALQKNLLSPLLDAETTLASLASLTTETPPTTDTELTALLASIRLRAKIELLRRGFEIT